MDSFCRLLENELIQQLLMFDVTLVGSVVRESMRPGFELSEFVDNGGVIVGQCPLTAKNFVERALFDQIIRSRIEMTTMANVVVHYMLHSENGRGTVRLRLGYYKIMQQEFPKCDVDINCLSLSRAGLFVDPLLVHSKPSNLTKPPPYISVPNPLSTLIHMCRNKRFSLISPQTDTVFKTMRASNLIQRGWFYMGSSLARVPPTEVPDDDVCSICSERFCENEPVFETRCGHMYHGKCWENYLKSKESTGVELGGIQTYIQLPSDISCPLCREHVAIYEALLPIKVA
jgi:hypothetical protein